MQHFGRSVQPAVQMYEIMPKAIEIADSVDAKRFIGVDLVSNRLAASQWSMLFAGNKPPGLTW